MERDALLAHGTSFLLQDRLMNCSDYSTAWVCRSCGSMISLGYDSSTAPGRTGGGEYCRVCREEGNEAAATSDVVLGVPRENVVSGGIGKGGDMDVIAVPYVFRYLAAEMACMGIKVRRRTSHTELGILSADLYPLASLSPSDLGRRQLDGLTLGLFLCDLSPSTFRCLSPVRPSVYSPFLLSVASSFLFACLRTSSSFPFCSLSPSSSSPPSSSSSPLQCMSL